MGLPIKNGKITTPFGVKGNMWSSGRHEGVDFAVPSGTPVVAPCNGTIAKVGQVWGSAFGQHSVLLHCKFGYVIFAHMKDYKVEVGQKVKMGDLLGHSGADGNVTGPHLHMELQADSGWTKGGGLDPKELLAWTPVKK